MKYPKSRIKNNRGIAYLKKRGANEVFSKGDEERSERRVVCVYCEVASKAEVTVLDGPCHKPYRGVPCGWSY